MIVTIGVIALNEENNIGALFNSIQKQSYDKKNIELVLVDSGSIDKTKQLMQDFQKENQNFYNSIKVLDNEGRIQASGWNVVIKNATGDVIIRVDAHAIITEDFVEKNVQCIESGESVCGGLRINVIKGDDITSKALLEAENSMFGGAVAGYRRNNEKKYVSTVAHACYKREVFKKVGLFDERLLRSEDNDMHYRIREAGYKICYTDEIVSYYQSRATVKSSLKQKYENGKWIGITSIVKTPKIFSLYHFIPAMFSCAIIASLALSIVSYFSFSALWFLSLPAYMLCFVYGLLMLVIFCITIKNQKSILVGVCTIVNIFLFHVSYGMGIIVGLFTGKRGLHHV